MMGAVAVVLGVLASGCAEGASLDAGAPDHNDNAGSDHHEVSVSPFV
jgi:hypothetical protein